jgi:nucleoside-diphosphate-sugar epimerase
MEPPDPLRGKRVLVTGGGGFIGAALVRALAARGAEVTALSRRSGRLEADATSYRFVGCDLLATQPLHDVFQLARPQLVYHLAACPDGAEDAAHTQRLIEHNIQAVANVVQAVVAHRCGGLVYGDSVKVYGDAPVPYRADLRPEPLSSYAVAKLAGWGLVDVARRLHGFNAMAVRPTLVYGPAQGFNLFTFLIKSIQPHIDQIALDGGAQSRDPIYIDDAVDAFLQAGRRLAACSGTTLPIGGNREISVADIARLTVRILNGRQAVVARPASQRPTETLRSWCDNAEATALLGWAPKVSLEAGILLTAESIAASLQGASPSRSAILAGPVPASLAAAATQTA